MLRLADISIIEDKCTPSDPEQDRCDVFRADWCRSIPVQWWCQDRYSRGLQWHSASNIASSETRYIRITRLSLLLAACKRKIRNYNILQLTVHKLQLAVWFMSVYTDKLHHDLLKGSLRWKRLVCQFTGNWQGYCTEQWSIKYPTVWHKDCGSVYYLSCCSITNILYIQW